LIYSYLFITSAVSRNFSKVKGMPDVFFCFAPFSMFALLGHFHCTGKGAFIVMANVWQYCGNIARAQRAASTLLTLPSLKENIFPLIMFFWSLKTPVPVKKLNWHTNLSVDHDFIVFFLNSENNKSKVKQLFPKKYILSENGREIKKPN
jgi:hypothetical protein